MRCIHVLFGIKEDPDRRCLNDFLWGRCKIEDAACDVTDALPGSNYGSPSALFLIPSSIKAGDIARILQEGYEVSILSDGFLQLVKALALDYLFIDTHPGVNEETLLSIAISDKLFVVLRPDHQDFQGTAVTVELARRLQVAEMALLVNKIPATMDVPGLREQVERVYQTPVAGMFQLTMHQDYQLPPNYVIFGNVVRGLEVVDTLAAVETTMGGDGAMSKPLSPLRIQKVTIRP